MSSLNDMIAALRAQMEERGVNVAALDEGSNHPYTCRCNTCRTWWQNTGPEVDFDDAGNEVSRKYGPFTVEEIEASDTGNTDKKENIMANTSTLIPVHIVKVAGTEDNTGLFVNGTLIASTYWPDAESEDLVVRDPHETFTSLGQALGMTFDVQFVTLEAAIVEEIIGLGDEWNFSNIEEHFDELLPYMDIHAAASTED